MLKKKVVATALTASLVVPVLGATVVGAETGDTTPKSSQTTTTDSNSTSSDSKTTTNGNDKVQKDDVVHETWSEPVFVKGVSLDATKLTSVKKDLAVKDNFKTLTMDGNKMVELLGEGDPSSNIYSSVVVQKTDKGDGVKVDIKTPNNITRITQDQYRNAALTAGLTDVNIEVASSVKATGEGALAGVYYAFKENGVKLDQKDMKLAQDEVSMLGKINEQNKGKDGFTDQQLNVAVADMKQDIAKLDEKQKQQLTKEDVEKIVDEKLKELNLQETVTGKQKDMVVNFMFNFKDSNIANNEEFVKQIGQYKDSVIEGSKEVFGKIKGFMDSEQGQNFLSSVGQFFKDIWNALGNFFSNLFGSSEK
ncbi:hypothetical protein COF68_04730 [Bacillus toyonensis]|uniref:DUF1002 domain-containing protein n=1 Tax=Bacillus toyonensis TaxID=155322 RepID=UPI000BFD2F39|nr:DUF1002 domain-containing protein [Bacillus toyonensis]PHE64156.1 hypothetical protein COF68_04730 [Bacillus toyonensis]